MILEPIFVIACLNFQGVGNENLACNTALNQFSNETKITAGLNLLESRARQEIEKSASHEVIFTVTALASIYNMYDQKQIIAQIPLNNKFELLTNITFSSSNYLVKYHLEY